MKMIRRLRNHLVIRKKEYFIFFLAFFMYIILQKIKNYDINLITDNVGMLASPTYLAGLNWTNIISFSSYYGYGFKWIYFLLFLITTNPYIIVFGIWTINALFVGLGAIVLYKILLKFFKSPDNIFTVLLTLITVYFADDFYFGGLGALYQESAIFVVELCMFYLVLKLIDEKNEKKLKLNVIFLSIISIYSVTIHERNIALVIITYLIIVIYFIYKRRKFPFLSFLLTNIICYGIHLFLKNNLITIFWSSKASTGELMNTSPVSGNITWFLEGFKAISILIEAVISNIVTLGFRTYGLSYVLFAAILILLFKIIKTKKFDTQNEKQYIIMLISCFTVLFVIFGVGVRWGKMIYLNNNIFGYKGFTYERYYIIYIWPGLVSLISLLYQKTKKEKIRVFSVGLLMAFISLLLFVLGPYHQLVNNYDSALQRLLPTILLFNSDSYRIKIIAYFLVMLIVLILLGFFRTKKVILFISFVCCISICSNLSNLNNDITFSQAYGGYDVVNYLQKENLIDYDSVYCTSRTRYSYQFMLNRYSIIYDYPESESNDILLQNISFINTEKSNEMIQNGFKYLILNDYEVIYYFGNSDIDIALQNYQL